jgi:hypothetical protein
VRRVVAITVLLPVAAFLVAAYVVGYLQARAAIEE